MHLHVHRIFFGLSLYVRILSCSGISFKEVHLHVTNRLLLPATRLEMFPQISPWAKINTAKMADSFPLLMLLVHVTLQLISISLFNATNGARPDNFSLPVNFPMFLQQLQSYEPFSAVCTPKVLLPLMVFFDVPFITFQGLELFLTSL